MIIATFIIFFIAAFCLGSMIEWFLHKELMHSVKYMKTPYIRHAVEHHAERIAPGKYYAKEDEIKEYHLIETSFMPVVWLLHAPFFYSVYHLFGLAASCGVMAGTGLYVLLYESLHWYMHCPDKFPFRDTRWFGYLNELHRVHHHKASVNFNVVCPLGDLLFGTYERALPIRREPEDIKRDTPLPLQYPQSGEDKQ